LPGFSFAAFQKVSTPAAQYVPTPSCAPPPPPQMSITPSCRESFLEECPMLSLPSSKNNEEIKTGLNPIPFLSADAEVWLTTSDRRFDAEILNVCLKT